MLSRQSFAQSLPTSRPDETPASWTFNATVAEESVGHGLPVLALDRPDWPSYRSGQEPNPHAWRSMRVELDATNPSGWRIGVLARAEAWLQASPDAVTAAALEATQSDPDVNRDYAVNARSQTWNGWGIRAGTPWLKLDAARKWQWQTDVQLLRLQQLRMVDLSGNVVYRGGDVYDFNLQSQRSNPGISDSFLAASDRSGLGVSLSVAVRGEPAPGWQVQLRADDLLSRLEWSNLATDTAALNSQVTSRAPDGSLDYAPLVQGQKALMRVARRIGTHWQAKASWSAFESRAHSGALTLRAERKAGLNQYWLGWDNRDAGQMRLHWRLEMEPARKAASLGLDWRGWHALVATDGKGAGSQLRSINLGWQIRL